MTYSKGNMVKETLQMVLSIVSLLRTLQQNVTSFADTIRTLGDPEPGNSGTLMQLGMLGS